MITWWGARGGAQQSTRGPHALTGGPSVQVQFSHLKISTLNQWRNDGVAAASRDGGPHW